jgi:hypothetical protein
MRATGSSGSPPFCSWPAGALCIRCWSSGSAIAAPLGQMLQSCLQDVYSSIFIVIILL